MLYFNVLRCVVVYSLDYCFYSYIMFKIGGG